MYGCINCAVVFICLSYLCLFCIFGCEGHAKVQTFLSLSEVVFGSCQGVVLRCLQAACNMSDNRHQWWAVLHCYQYSMGLHETLSDCDLYCDVKGMVNDMSGRWIACMRNENKHDEQEIRKNILLSLRVTFWCRCDLWLFSFVRRHWQT